jgi:hypothetical protein
MNGISVIVPVHNNAAVVLDTLTSVERSHLSRLEQPARQGHE